MIDYEGDVLQIGAFRDKEKAFAASKRLEELTGKPTIIVYEDGYHKVRISGYANRNLARQFATTIAKAGFPVSYIPVIKPNTSLQVGEFLSEKDALKAQKDFALLTDHRIIIIYSNGIYKIRIPGFTSSESARLYIVEMERNNVKINLVPEKQVVPQNRIVEPIVNPIVDNKITTTTEKTIVPQKNNEEATNKPVDLNKVKPSLEKLVIPQKQNDEITAKQNEVIKVTPSADKPVVTEKQKEIVPIQSTIDNNAEVKQSNENSISDQTKKTEDNGPVIQILAIKDSTEASNAKERISRAIGRSVTIQSENGTCTGRIPGSILKSGKLLHQ